MSTIRRSRSLNARRRTRRTTVGGGFKTDELIKLALGANAEMSGGPVSPNSSEFLLPQEPWSPAAILIGLGIAAIAVYALVSDSKGGDTARRCGVCGRVGHDRRTCPIDAPRVNFPGAIPRSRRCECCGQFGYRMQQHHTRGRGVVSDGLDVCLDCHTECCHGGHFQNFPSKPQICRLLDRPSFWRGNRV
jgi:hypothetical protein